MTAPLNYSVASIPGKYGRLFVASSAGALLPVTFKKVTATVEADDIPNPSSEDGGFKNGLTGLVGLSATFEMPYQVHRTGQIVAPGLSFLFPTALVVYEIWLIHTDNSAAFGSLMRYTGVGRVLGGPTDIDMADKIGINVRVESKGGIYLPGTAAPTPGQMLANFTNELA